MPEQKQRSQRSWRFPFVHFQQRYYGFSIVIYMKLEAKGGFPGTKKQPKYAPGHPQLGCEGCDSLAGQTLQQNYGASW